VTIAKGLNLGGRLYTRRGGGGEAEPGVRRHEGGGYGLGKGQSWETSQPHMVPGYLTNSHQLPFGGRGGGDYNKKRKEK